MITEVENIILSKEYFELTPEELTTVSELVQNAEEYDEMKWFLASTQQTLVSEQIEATPELKEKVMEHLHSEAPQRKFWLNSVFIFMWPQEKEIHRRPAFQMSIAAVLLIGIMIVFKSPVDEQEMAMTDTTIEQPDGSLDEVITSDEELSDNQFLPEDDGVTEDVEPDLVLAPADIPLELEEEADEEPFVHSDWLVDGDAEIISEIDALEYKEQFDAGQGNAKTSANNRERDENPVVTLQSKSTDNYKQLDEKKKLLSGKDKDKDRRSFADGSKGKLKKDRYRNDQSKKTGELGPDNANNSVKNEPKNEIAIGENKPGKNYYENGNVKNPEGNAMGGAYNTTTNTGAVLNTETQNLSNSVDDADANDVYFSYDSNNDFIPEFFTVKTSKELKPLFRTFK